MPKRRVGWEKIEKREERGMRGEGGGERSKNDKGLTMLIT